MRVPRDSRRRSLFVDLRYSDNDEKFRSELRAWLEEAVPGHGDPPPAHDWPARRAYDTSWQRKLHEAGYACINWPKEYGGRDASPTEQLVYYEEIGRAKAPYVGINFVGVKHGGPTVIAEGTPEQKARHIPQILRGEQTWCQGFSEPSAGSDLASLRTRAERDGDHYVVNGHKIWTTYAQVADYCELLVRTDPDVRKHAGISWLILPMDLPGIEIRPLKTLLGEGEFSEVFLEDVRVPVDHRVGEENDGWRVTNVTLRFERGTAFASAIYSQQEFLADIVRLAAGLTRGGGRVWDEPALRAEVGHLKAELDSLWAMVKMGVSEVSESGVPGLGGAAVKLMYAELDQRLGDLAIRVLGRGGLSRDDVAGLPNQRFLMAALKSLNLTIAAGTSQIQRNIIAERILGLPKDR
jgi:alkylation response protein AidB-like acyl-CoA dehydrogenase